MDASENQSLLHNPYTKEEGSYKSTSISKFRPISYCNTTNKVISRTLAIKSAGGSHQSAFLKEAFGENYMLAFEFLRGFNNKQRARKACLKVEIAKAFDTTDWFGLELTV